MGFRQGIRDCAAIAYLETCKLLGEQITFYERGAGGVTLWAMPSGGEVGEVDRLKVRSEQHSTKFNIPRQSNFPPANGPSINSEIVDADGNRWRIVPAIDVDSVEAVYKCPCERIKAKAV